MAVAAEAMNDDERTQFERLTGTQKSAILMMLLGEDEASEIIRNLSPKEVQHLGTAMYSVQGLDQDTVNAVLDEFLAIIKAQSKNTDRHSWFGEKTFEIDQNNFDEKLLNKKSFDQKT